MYLPLLSQWFFGKLHHHHNNLTNLDAGLYSGLHCLSVCLLQSHLPSLFGISDRYSTGLTQASSPCSPPPLLLNSTCERVRLFHSSDLPNQFPKPTLTQLSFCFSASPPSALAPQFPLLVFVYHSLCSQYLIAPVHSIPHSCSFTQASLLALALVNIAVTTSLKVLVHFIVSLWVCVWVHFTFWLRPWHKEKQNACRCKSLVDKLATSDTVIPPTS